MDDILKDKRFTKLVNDPRYRQIPKNERKVKIDQRFRSMFDNEKFKIKYSVDKRGRPVQQTSSENLKKYYELGSEDSDSDDEDETKDVETESTHPGQYVMRKKDEESSDEVKDQAVKKKSDGDKDEYETEDGPRLKNDQLENGKLDYELKKKLRDLDIDYARGEAALFTDSSSDEESSSEEGEDGIEHAWGELDADAETTEEATHRLAICNMDWDYIKALDLFVLLNSFLPPGGVIKSVTIYPSEFGQKRLREEELRGPIELTETKLDADNSDDEEKEEGSKYHMEKLRLYQLNRLKYYYAVAVFDSANTANKIYTDCDGLEYESSSAKLDLRFVPDDATFDQEVHDECTELSDITKYKPRLFTTTALQQAKVELTWDSANPQRSQILKDAADGEIKDEDLRNYLAYSSEDSEEEIEKPVSADEDNNDVDPISKYKALLQEIEDGEKKKKNRDVEMEITWGMGLKEKTEELVKKKMTKGNKLTPFEELIEKKKEKKKAKKLERKKKIEKAKKGSDEEDDNDEYSSDDIPSDVDMNDPYFAEEFKDPEFQKPKKFKKKVKKDSLQSEDDVDEEENRKKAELELLLDDDDGKQHFSLKKIQEAENESKSKKKRKYKQKSKSKIESKDGAIDDFEINTKDERFSSLFSSHHFNIDPSNPNFKKTKNMDKLIQEKLKRRPTEKVEESATVSKKSKIDAEMSLLVKSIKRKTQNQ